MTTDWSDVTTKHPPRIAYRKKWKMRKNNVLFSHYLQNPDLGQIATTDASSTAVPQYEKSFSSRLAKSIIAVYYRQTKCQTAAKRHVQRRHLYRDATSRSSRLRTSLNHSEYEMYSTRYHPSHRPVSCVQTRWSQTFSVSKTPDNRM